MAKDDRATVKAAKIATTGAVLAALVGGSFLVASTWLSLRSTHKPEPAVSTGDKKPLQQADQPTAGDSPEVQLPEVLVNQASQTSADNSHAPAATSAEPAPPQPGRQSAETGSPKPPPTSGAERDESLIVVHYADPRLAEIAAEIERLLGKHGAEARVEGPPPMETDQGDCDVRIIFSYKDATRRDQAEKYWSTVSAQWQDTSRSSADDTLVSEFQFSLQCSR